MCFWYSKMEAGPCNLNICNFEYWNIEVLNFRMFDFIPQWGSTTSSALLLVASLLHLLLLVLDFLFWCPVPCGYTQIILQCGCCGIKSKFQNFNIQNCKFSNYTARLPFWSTKKTWCCDKTNFIWKIRGNPLPESCVGLSSTFCTGWILKKRIIKLVFPQKRQKSKIPDFLF